jgi:sulfite reductase (NADPH) flavoprotein alpha-component
MTEDMVNHADVFKAFPSARPALEQLINMVPVIKPRSYSIASSPLMHPDEIELCVVAVDWEVPSLGETRFGQCTSYMKTQEAGATVMCSVKARLDFPSLLLHSLGNSFNHSAIFPVEAR